LTDRQTDGQTDRQTSFSLLDRPACSVVKNVKEQLRANAVTSRHSFPTSILDIMHAIYRSCDCKAVVLHHRLEDRGQFTESIRIVVPVNRIYRNVLR